MVNSINTNCLASAIAMGVAFLGCSGKHPPIENESSSGAPAPFSLTTNDDSRALRNNMAIARDECIDALKSHAQSKGGPETEDQALVAAILLGKLRANDEESLNALSSNLSLRSLTLRAPHPLNAYVAAEAIVQIGGPQARSAIVRKLQSELDDSELLICAHILHRLDDLEIILAYLSKAMRDSTDPRHRSNLERMIELISSDNFPQDKKYWPGESRALKSQRVAQIGIQRRVAVGR